MTQISIKQQIAAIRIATARATKSPTAAIKFLRDAGIIKQSTKSNKAAAKK